ncbi:MAG: dockerin type I repeat-containing protein, partial [Muribaculaceae bacterium]|nr:dockerin type I repeat-containing protein [Muribaculaceae bacterium]
CYFHTGDNRKYYLYETNGGTLGSTGIGYASTFNAIEILVEEETVPVTDVTLTPYNVYTPNNVQTDPAEDYYKLFDKNKSTKWCVDNSTGSWETIWVDFKSNVAFIPTSYTMTTGNDTQSWSGRNPKKWKIYAKAKESDSWTTIVDVNDGDALGLGTVNTTDYSFNINGITKKYQFFRFEVSEVRGKGGWQNNHYVFQLAELALSGYTSSSAIPGDVNGDGVVTSVDVTALYNYLLNNDSSAIVNGDQDGDGVITSVDITIIYNILLGN